MPWAFHTTDEGGDDKFLVCSMQRNQIEDQRSSHKQQVTQVTLQFLQENHSRCYKDGQNGPKSDANSGLSNMLIEEIFVSCGPTAFQEHLQEDNIQVFCEV